jgi:hypothetical protein
VIRGRSGLPGGDRGAYAVLYAITMTVFIAFAAVVVDLSSLRLDRRVDRLAADAAALAGAAYLHPGDTRDPEQACLSAWAYLDGNIGPLDASAAPTACGGFASYRGNVPCPVAQIDQSTTVGDFGVTVSWPVLDVSALMTQPDVRPGTVAAPNPDTLWDGIDPCARIGVTVTRSRSFVLAPAFGVSGGSTEVHSVAAAAPAASGDEVAALIALDEQRLATLCARQGGSISASSYDDAGQPRPGIIAVDSDGSAGAHGCSGADDYVIFADTEPGTRICADGIEAGAGCDGEGYIDSYAKGPFGDSARSHDPAAPLAPLPGGVAERIGTGPVFGRYGCATSGPLPAAGCHTPNYIDSLGAQLGGPGEPIGYTALRDGQPIPGSNPPVPFQCRADTPVFIPNDRWFVDCDEFDASANVVFGGGRVVFKGTVSVSGGCLGINVPLEGLNPGDPVAACPAVEDAGTATATTQPAPTSNARVYIRGRAGAPSFAKDGAGTILLPRTFVYLQDGSMQMSGGGGSLLWTHVKATGCPLGDEDCRASRFDKLAFWSQAGATHEIQTHDAGGPAGNRLDLMGVLFAGGSHLRFSGDDATLRAQLWADTIEVVGPAELTWAPGPTSAVPTQRSRIRLIR